MSVAEKEITTTRKTISQTPDWRQESRLFHRSRKRIKELGEVFTPETYVIDMLKLINRNNRGLWSDEHICFFEPCCGHGNIIEVIYRKRLEGLYKKARRLDYEKPAFYAVANAINTLWAIDIDTRNVVHSKMRLLESSLKLIKEKTSISNDISIISSEPEFFAHLLCAINWHIHENETLSSLSDTENAYANARKTQAGLQWFLKNDHCPIDFGNNWIDHFRAQKVNKLLPFTFERSTRFIKNILAGKEHRDVEFEFADFLIGKPERCKDLATG